MTREVGTRVVPGHGHICDQFDVVYYRDMVTVIRDNVRDMKTAGMTLTQVQAAKPAAGYAGTVPGANTGPWTTNMFIEAIYKTVAAVKS